MATLRIAQHPSRAPGQYTAEITAEVPGMQPQSARVEFGFALTSQEQEEIRWYLEDFLEFDHEPAPTIARAVEQRMAEHGEGLFRAIFHGSDEARELWTVLRVHLADTRIEITTDIASAHAIPWELIHDPRVGPLALQARALVRTQRGAITALAPAQAKASKVRILLVICRPKGGADVPFRSVASRLAKGLSEDARESFDLDVLRPPTYEHLARVLRQAKESGRPYHIVHFDGHGIYANPADLKNAGKVLSHLRLDAGATGHHGYLLFENPEDEHNAAFVEGSRLGRLLTETAVPVLILNACQSAFAQATVKPHEATGGDTRDELATYGSLAQEVIDAGTSGVVAMRYSVYVVTAARFVAELYSTLAQGHTLGEAVTRARKNLADNPERQIAYDPRPLQDWCVPVVYERAALRLWPKRKARLDLIITFDEGAGGAASLDQDLLRARPDVGFYGRDETLYALDRAFDKHSIVLLHAYAGSGKTATAAEFALWYAQTGGINGPVLFSSFAHHLPLAHVLDQIGQVFGPALERAGVQWDAITDLVQRRNSALQVLAHVPVLWVWDNVEPVTGFPKGTPSDWSAMEQTELLDFLRAAGETKAKFLLTSRREEREWLTDLPVRIAVPPMPMRERLQLAGAIAERHGKRLRALPDLRPLLQWTQGNPLTVLVTVGQALRDNIDTAEKLADYIKRLRGGEAGFQDEAAEGRSKSLGASLSYGFARAFNEDERKMLALLRLFQGHVCALVLMRMGDPEFAPSCLAFVHGVTLEEVISLLDRAEEVGLLTSQGGGYYAIHPALPWYFRKLFDREYSAASGAGDSPALQATRAFVEATAMWGTYLINEYEAGNRDLIAQLTAEEDNLLHAWRLARSHGWWRQVTGTMLGLKVLYRETGRRPAWERLVRAVVPEFIEPDTEGPLPGREREWGKVTEWCVRLLERQLRWEDAQKLQEALVAWQRERTKAILSLDIATMTTEQDEIINNFVASLDNLAFIQRARGDAACEKTYMEEMYWAQRLGNRLLQISAASNLGRVHLQVAALRDLGQAEKWYRRALALVDSKDNLNRSYILQQLGEISLARFAEARDTGRPREELIPHLDDAELLLHEALGLLSPVNVEGLMSCHYELGNLYRSGWRPDMALPHYREALRLSEQVHNLILAFGSRIGICAALYNLGRFDEALLYAQASMENLETYGDQAASQIQRVKALIVEIEKRKAQGD